MNQDSQTVTLDKVKTIDVAKIIRNEARLLDYIASLEKEVVKLNDSINTYVERNEQSAITMRQMLDQIVEGNKKVAKLSDEQLQIERKLRKFGLYTYTAISGNQNGLQGLDLGFAFANRKKLFTVSVDPFLFNGLSYKIGFGLKVF